MNRLPSHTFALTCLCAAVLAGCGGGDIAAGPTEQAQAVRQVPGCRGPNDSPEAALQGQVPAAMRAAGLKGFNCNLQLVGQLEGEGGNWSSATFNDKNGRTCLYYATATDRPGRINKGVPVIDSRHL